MVKRSGSGRGARVGRQQGTSSRKQRASSPALRKDLEPLMYHATSLQACGSNDEAAEVYAQVLQEQPDHWLALNNLAVVLDIAGDPGAEDLFRRVVKLAPGYADGWGNLGRFLQRKERYEEARAAYRQALSLDPNHKSASEGMRQLDSGALSAATDGEKAVDNLLVRIAVLQRQGHPEEALALLDQCRDRIPPVQWLVQRGQLLANAKRWPQAVDAFREALAADGSRWDALRGLAHTLSCSGRGKEVEAMAAAYDAKGDVFSASMLRGLPLVDQGKYGDAIECFRRAAAARPNEIDGHFYEGVCALKGGDNEAAESAFRRVLALNPDHGPSLNNLGNVLVGTGRLRDAVEVLERARKIYPDDVVLLNTLGLALTRLDRFAEAEPILKAAVAINKNFVEGWSNLAKAKLDSARPDEAEPLFRKAIEVSPDFPLARYNLGLSLFQLGRIEEAVSNLEETLRLDPAFAPAHHNLGMLCLLLGRYEQGWRHYQWRDSRQLMERAVRGWQPDTPPLPASIEGKWISLTGEQGIGDELFFLRFVPELKALGANIVYRPNSPKLKFLFEQMPFLDVVLEPQQVVAEGAVYDGLIGDLPYLLKMRDAAQAPPPVPIAADQARIAGFFLRWLQDLPPPYIGVCWRAGSKQSRQDAEYNEQYQKLYKELTLDDLIEALKGIPATFVVLQRNPLPGEVERFSAGVGRPVLDCSDLNDDLPEMLSALSCLDDILGVSNTNYHLRAGLGLKGRVLVPKHPEFRWMAEGDSSPWFPGFKVYREDLKRGWKPALAALRSDIVRDLELKASASVGTEPEPAAAVVAPDGTEAQIERRFAGVAIRGVDFLPLYRASLEDSDTLVPLWKLLRRAERALVLAERFVDSLDVPGERCECGVFRGFSALLAARLARRLGHEPVLTLIDSFEGLSQPTAADLRVTTTPNGSVVRETTYEAGHFATDVQHVRQVMAEFPATRILKGWVPQVFGQLPESRYAFVHLDLDLYEPIKAGLEYFFPRMADGGIIVNDDYASPGFPGAGKAWREFFEARGLAYEALATGQAVYVHRAGIDAGTEGTATISPAYAELNRDLHRTEPQYGTRGSRWADFVRALANDYGIKDVLDYGCGKQSLKAALPELDVRGYDPGIEELAAPPQPAGLVVCTDVLEHVEPEMLDNVLADLARLMKTAGFVAVNTRPASKSLADGRNAHLTVQPAEWWLARLRRHFDVLDSRDFDDGLILAAVVGPLAGQ